jgi:hypothetical protein
MTTIALRTSHFSHAPKLRLVPKKVPATATDRDEQAAARVATFPPDSPVWHEASSDDDSPVLVAGWDRGARAEVLDGLAAIMPAGTLFQEVGTFWEVLVRAPLVRMVVISGELDGIPTESLMHMLSHRHPELPVVSLDALAAGEHARASA